VSNGSKKLKKAEEHRKDGHRQTEGARTEQGSGMANTERKEVSKQFRVSNEIKKMKKTYTHTYMHTYICTYIHT
jgi:hypothetical protein